MIDSLVPASCMNLIFLIIAHKLLKLPGGWVGPKDLGPIMIARMRNKLARDRFKMNSKILFEALSFKSTKDTGVIFKDTHGMQSLVGMLIIASYFFVTISSEYKIPNSAMQFISCIVGGLMFIYPLWKNHVQIHILNSVTLYSLFYLIASSLWMMFANGFSSISVLSFLMSVIVLGFCVQSFFHLSILAITLTLTTGIFKFAGYEFVIANVDVAVMLIYGVITVGIISLSFIGNYKTQIDHLTLSQSHLQYLNKMLTNQISLRETNLKKSVNLQRDILKNINHEIRAPMHHLMTSTEAFLEFVKYSDGTTKEDNIKVAQAMKDSVDRFYKYAANMMDLGQYQEGSMLFDIQKNNFKEVFEELMLGYDNILFDYNAPLEAEFDKLKMTQMLEELIKNADEYSTHGPIIINIFVEKMRGADHIKVTVGDSGVGIEESELEEIFQPFYVGERTKDLVGRGLGLSIAREIMRGHQGSIIAENNVGRRGVTVSFYFPVVRVKSEFLASNARVVGAGDEIDVQRIISEVSVVETQLFGKAPKIIAIDNDPTVCELYKMLSESCGYQYKSFTSGDEAAKYILSNNFDGNLVLLDMILEDMTGLDLMKRVSEKLARSGVTVVIHSGFSIGEDAIQECFTLGVQVALGAATSQKGFKEMVMRYLGIVI